MARIGDRLYSNIKPWAYEVCLEAGVEDPTPIVNLLVDKLSEDMEVSEAWEEAKRILREEVPGISGLYLQAGKPPEDVIEEEVEKFEEEHQSAYVERTKELEEARAEREKREEAESKLRGAEQRIRELEKKLERRAELSEEEIDRLEEELEFLQQVSGRLLEDIPTEKVKRLRDEFLKIEGADEGDFWQWFGENIGLIKEKSKVLPFVMRENYMEPWFEKEETEEEVKEEAEEVEEVTEEAEEEGISKEAIRELTQRVVEGPPEAPEHAPRDPDTGTPLRRLEDILPIDLPPGMVYYVSTDPESKHYKQIFSLTKKGNLGRTTSLKTILKNLRKTKRSIQREMRGVESEERPKTAPERVERKRVRAPEEHPRFRDFLEEEFDMTMTEFRGLSKTEKKWFRQAFSTWLRGH